MVDSSYLYSDEYDADNSGQTISTTKSSDYVYFKSPHNGNTIYDVWARLRNDDTELLRQFCQFWVRDKERVILFLFFYFFILFFVTKDFN